MGRRGRKMRRRGQVVVGRKLTMLGNFRFPQVLERKRGVCFHKAPERKSLREKEGCLFPQSPGEKEWCIVIASPRKEGF
jgi:hypothetical protein